MDCIRFGVAGVLKKEEDSSSSGCQQASVFAEVESKLDSLGNILDTVDFCLDLDQPLVVVRRFPRQMS